MGEPVQISIDKDVLQDLLIRARRIAKPEAKYNPNTETYLKGVIAAQQDEGGYIDAYLTNLLYPG